MLTNIRSQLNFTFSPRFDNPQFIIILAALTLPIIAGVAATFAGMLVPLVLLGIVYTIIVFMNPRIGLYSMVALLPFDSFFLISDSISLTRLVGILAFSAWIVRTTSLSDVTMSLRQKLSVGLLLLTILSFTSLLWSKYKSEVIVDLISQLQLLILYFFVISQVNSWKKLRRVLLVFFAAVLMSIPFALYQFYGVEVRRGGTGLSGTVNEFAVQIIISIPILLYFMQTKKTGLLGKIFFILALILLLLGLAISQSRTSLLILPIIIILQFRLTGWKPSKKILLLMALFFSLVIASIFAPTTSIIERFLKDVDATSGTLSFLSTRGYLWGIALSEFAQHPILGLGFNNFQHHYLHTYQFVYPGAEKILPYGLVVHNTFLSILVQLGIIGIIITLYILWQLLIILRAAKKNTSNNFHHSLLVGTLTNCLIAFLLYSTTTSSLLSKLLWLLLGLAMAAYFLSLKAKKLSQKTVPSL